MAHTENCALVWSGWELPRLRFVLKPHPDGFELLRQGTVEEAVRYQYRMAKGREVLGDAPIYDMTGHQTLRERGGATYLQVRSCNEVACSRVWSQPFFVYAGKTDWPTTTATRRRAPARTTTTQSKAYQCEYMAQSFNKAVRAEAYEYATSLLEEMYKMGC